MAKLIKFVFPVFWLAIIFIPVYSTAQVNYSGGKDKYAESVDRQEERRIEQNRKANERKKAALQRQNQREQERRMRNAQKQQRKMQNYSIERDIKSRRLKKEDKTKPTPEERLVMKLEKQKAREDAKKDKLAEKERKKMLKTYHKKVSGAGKDIANRKKVYKRMKKSKRIANKNNRR